MSEQEKQESQKTVVAFIAGLLIGGLLVWVFSGNPENTAGEMNENNDDESAEVMDEETEEMNETEDEAAAPAAPAVAELPIGDGAVNVEDQSAGASVALASATFPSDEGWIGVRDYSDGQMGGLLGVARYSKEQGLVPQSVILQRSTVAGNTYAVVFYSENGDRVFNLADDVQVGGVVETFVAR